MTPDNSKYLESCIKAQAWNIAHRLKTPEAVEDYQQDLRLAIMPMLAKWNPARASLRTFCDRITRSAARGLIRRHRRTFPLVSPEDDGGRHSRDTQIAIDVSGVMAELPPEFWQVVELLMAGKSYRYIASVMGLTRWKLERRFILPLRRICMMKGLHGYLRGGQRTGHTRGPGGGRVLPPPTPSNQGRGKEQAC